MAECAANFATRVLLPSATQIARMQSVSRRRVAATHRNPCLYLCETAKLKKEEVGRSVGGANSGRADIKPSGG